MLIDEFVAVQQASNADELLAETVRFTRRLGFDFVSATVVVDRFNKGSDFFCVDNMTAEYRPIFSNPEGQLRDPINRHCKHSNLPIMWGRQVYADAGLIDLWEEQSPHGLKAGIGLALHLPKGLHFFIGVDRDQELPDDPRETLRMAADLRLFASCAQEAAFRVQLPRRSEPEPPPLSPRETESLRWTMEGKTVEEIGRIFGISERSVARHLKGAMRKLGCVNPYHAVSKALWMELIK